MAPNILALCALQTIEHPLSQIPDYATGVNEWMKKGERDRDEGCSTDFGQSILALLE